MTITAIGPQPLPPISGQGERGRDINAIGQALDSNDLQGAQQAFTQFKQDFHRVHHGASLGQTNVPEQVKSDLRALQSALKANDLQGAQQAFAIFTADMQNVAGIQRDPQPKTSSGGLNVVA